MLQLLASLGEQEFDFLYAQCKSKFHLMPICRNLIPTQISNKYYLAQFFEKVCQYVLHFIDFV